MKKGSKMSQESVEKMRQKKLGNKYAVGGKSRTGLTNSLKQIEAIKKANTGREKPKEEVEQIQKSCAQFYIDHPEAKDKCHTMDGKTMSEESNQKKSDANKGIPKSEEHKAKTSLGVKKYYKDNPEAYEKQVQHCLEIGPHTNRKPGWYKGIYCQSSWELAYVVYNIEQGIVFTKNKEGFEYTYQGIIKKYYPDFIEGTTYIEIKGWKEDVDDSKWSCFRDIHKKELRVLYDKDIVKYINYVIEKYGENFTEALYEKTDTNNNG